MQVHVSSYVFRVMLPYIHIIYPYKCGIAPLLRKVRREQR